MVRVITKTWENCLSKTTLNEDPNWKKLTQSISGSSVYNADNAFVLGLDLRLEAIATWAISWVCLLDTASCRRRAVHDNGKLTDGRLCQPLTRHLFDAAPNGLSDITPTCLLLTSYGPRLCLVTTYCSYLPAIEKDLFFILCALYKCHLYCIVSSMFSCLT